MIRPYILARSTALGLMQRALARRIDLLIITIPYCIFASTQAFSGRFSRVVIVCRHRFMGGSHTPWQSTRPRRVSAVCTVCKCLPTLRNTVMASNRPRWARPLPERRSFLHTPYGACHVDLGQWRLLPTACPLGCSLACCLLRDCLPRTP